MVLLMNNVKSTYQFVTEFIHKYPMTIGWRLKKNSNVIDQHLTAGEKVLYAFVAQKNDRFYNIINTAVVALTNKRILVGRDRVVIGYFLDSITPDLFNDLKVRSGIIWGKVKIDTVKELIVLTNIDKHALSEVEREITSFMIQHKENIKKEKTA